MDLHSHYNHRLGGRRRVSRLGYRLTQQRAKDWMWHKAHAQLTRTLDERDESIIAENRALRSQVATLSAERDEATHYNGELIGKVNRLSALATRQGDVVEVLRRLVSNVEKYAGTTGTTAAAVEHWEDLMVAQSAARLTLARLDTDTPDQPATHVPDRMMALTTNPPMWRCSCGTNHYLDWDGWTPTPDQGTEPKPCWPCESSCYNAKHGDECHRYANGHGCICGCHRPTPSPETGE